MNFLHDQKDIWMFPLDLAKGHHWLPALFITGGTAVFLATDAQTVPHFRQTTDFHDFNRLLGATATVPPSPLCPRFFTA